MLSFLSHDEISHLISAYGYWVVGGVVALESIGIPVPGETALVAAAIYAATTQELNIWLVIVAAACGAIFGDNIGMAIGREIGYRLLTRYGPRIGLSERRIKLGQYLFRRHGGKVVFFGRFVAVLRALAAFLAGANCMPWRRFIAYNAAGGVVWATLYGLSAYYFGAAVQHVARPVGVAAAAAAVIAVIGSAIFLRRNERRMEDEAERAMPGPLRPPGGWRQRA
ncbi:MAG TPA: DedA family protein [Stellaceae bacterium]